MQKKKKTEKKKCIHPYINITIYKLLVGVIEFGYIRKMPDLGKVPSKAAKAEK